MNLHLFFDVYIEDAPLGVYLRGDRKRFDVDHRIRSGSPAYRYQTKYDITRYSLASYAEIDWDSVTLRIECGHPAFEGIYQELREQFPSASIARQRSDTAIKYHHALEELNLKNNPWIFFSPNNDHPFINHREKLSKIIADADEAVKRTNADIVSIPYSHYTECMNFFSPQQHEWGTYGGVFPKLLYETDHSYVIKNNRLLIDSLHVYRYDDLKWIFGNSKRTSRVIRPEDTEFYLSQVKSHVMVLPKFELCRHYDGYLHVADKVPPLFIPEGFFSKSIRIRYGYDKPVDGYVNINPIAKKFSFQDQSGADLKIIKEDIPHFWRERISELDINPNFIEPPRKKIRYYQELVNPWSNVPKFVNFLRSLNKYAKQIRRTQ